MKRMTAMAAESVDLEMSTSPPSEQILTEARSLRATLKDLRRKLENLQRHVSAEPSDKSSSDDQRPTGYTNHSDQSSDTVSERMDKEQVRQSEEEQTSSTAPQEESSEARGLTKIRRATVAIVGDMQGKGLRIADTLVRCGVRKVILFDWIEASERVEQARQLWEDEDNPSLELETYVSAYELNDDSYEHFLDRVMVGGTDNRPVDLIVLSSCENISATAFRLLSKATSAIDCPLLYSDNSVIFVAESSGHDIQIEEANTTLAMAALEFLLV